jgi:hypothetical protein
MKRVEDYFEVVLLIFSEILTEIVHEQLVGLAVVEVCADLE